MECRPLTTAYHFVVILQQIATQRYSCVRSFSVQVTQKLEAGVRLCNSPSEDCLCKHLYPDLATAHKVIPASFVLFLTRILSGCRFQLCQWYWQVAKIKRLVCIELMPKDIINLSNNHSDSEMTCCQLRYIVHLLRYQVMQLVSSIRLLTHWRQWQWHQYYYYYYGNQHKKN